MGWLIAIWLFAAFCGWLVHIAYEPVLEIAAQLAYSVSPELVGPIAALAGTPGLRTVVAIGTALAIGLVLTGIWFVLRLLTGAGRRAAKATRRQPSSAPIGQRTDWQLETAQRAPRGSGSPPPREPEPEPIERRDPPRPRDPFDPDVAAPRWGRQPKNGDG